VFESADPSFRGFLEDALFVIEDEMQRCFFIANTLELWDILLKKLGQKLLKLAQSHGIDKKAFEDYFQQETNIMDMYRD